MLRERIELAVDNSVSKGNLIGKIFILLRKMGITTQVRKI